jgi:hypothetical protein
VINNFGEDEHAFIGLSENVVVNDGGITINNDELIEGAGYEDLYM